MMFPWSLWAVCMQGNILTGGLSPAFVGNVIYVFCLCWFCGNNGISHNIILRIATLLVPD